VILGPVRVVSREGAETADPTEILHAIRDEVTRETISTIPFWVDTFVAVNDDNSVTTDCRITNEEWPEATERLAAVAKDILPTTHGFRSWRQFLFFDPVTSPFSSPDNIVDDRPWWKRLVPFS
jgi:hypothetical protein